MSGGIAQRRIYYLVRRHLRISTREWDGLAWWEQMTYLDGLEEEGVITLDRGGDPNSRVVAVHQDGGTTITEREASATFSGEPGEMAAFGFNETTLG